MILTIICCAAMQGQAAADFFPAVPGTIRTYEQKGGGSSVVTNKIGRLLDMGGVSVIPVTESGSGSNKTTYYRVEADQVTIVAFDVKKPLVNPMPVLKMGTGKIAWDYEGATEVGRGGERLLEHGEARLGGQKTVLGKKVDTITVKLAAAVGFGISGETFDQTTVYGKGLGMIEQTTKMTLGKRTVTTSYKLIAIEAEKQ